LHEHKHKHGMNNCMIWVERYQVSAGQKEFEGVCVLSFYGFGFLSFYLVWLMSSWWVGFGWVGDGVGVGAGFGFRGIWI
jgi:hypothetical protein